MCGCTALSIYRKGEYVFASDNPFHGDPQAFAKGKDLFRWVIEPSRQAAGLTLYHRKPKWRHNSCALLSSKLQATLKQSPLAFACSNSNGVRVQSGSYLSTIDRNVVNCL